MTIYEETGSESDIWKNVDTLGSVTSECLEMQKQVGLSRNIMMIGNDVMNVNDMRNTTVNGTNQNSYIHHDDAFRITLDFWINQIDKAIEVSPVTVIGIPGNHARDMENKLLIALKFVYRDNEFVDIDDCRIERKVLSYGNNLFFFEHGHNFSKKNYSAAMASHYSDLWAKHQYRYCFLGHYHHEQVFDLPGIDVTVARGTCEDDYWHFNKGYLGIPKTAYAYWFSKCGKWKNRLDRMF